MKAIATGRTFEHRKLFMQLDGWFNRDRQCWEFEHLDETDLQLIRNVCVGVSVIVEQKKHPCGS